ncbi:MAG: CapA family protein [Betaproteobacteria bacterium]|nr:CapA family protein [Betaproteobacteria bacterium]
MQQAAPVSACGAGRSRGADASVGSGPLTASSNSPERGHVTLFLSGDVMLGRGIDQILPNPSDPCLYESFITSAKDYVALAERVNGPIPSPVDFGYVWGDAAHALGLRAPDLRIVNLETSITKSGLHEPKGINYRMNPANIACLKAMRIDCCVLANNHVLDWSQAGLLETLESLERAKIAYAGAGRAHAEAASPAILKAKGRGRVLVFGFGLTTSGIPTKWAAGRTRAGVNVLDGTSAKAITCIADGVRSRRLPGDLLIASIHWGSNWGYDIPVDQRSLAHDLIDTAGFDIVHGHSSHHPKGIEVYRGKLILYGCGDFLNDYEGIKGLGPFRGDLAVAYLAQCSATTGDLEMLSLLPFQIRNFRLTQANDGDRAWLATTLNRESKAFGTQITLGQEGVLTAHWQ